MVSNLYVLNVTLMVSSPLWSTILTILFYIPCPLSDLGMLQVVIMSKINIIYRDVIFFPLFFFNEHVTGI